MAKDDAGKEDLKNLPPEERIKRLKKLEEEKKKEIAEAEKEIRDSEEEITDRKKWKDRVPIPEFAREDLDHLSQDALEILKTRGLIKAKQPENASPKAIVKKEESLEDTVVRERVSRVPEGMQMQYDLPGRQDVGVAYKPLSQMDMMGISKEIKNIYQAVEERGYITGEEQKKVGYALSEVEKRLEDVQDGKYRNFNEQVAEAANLIQKIGSQMYHSNKPGVSGRMYQS